MDRIWTRNTEAPKCLVKRVKSTQLFPLVFGYLTHISKSSLEAPSVASRITLATPDDLERSGKLFQVLAPVIRCLNYICNIKIRPIADIKFRVYFRKNHLSSKVFLSFNSSNLAAIVGFLRVNFLIVTSCALSFARRRFLSVPNRASFVFCR